MHPDRWAIFALAVVLVAIAAIAAVAIPWDAGRPGERGKLSVDADFTEHDQRREERFHQALRPWTLTSMALGAAVAVLLGVTPIGARIISALAKPLGGSWPVTAIVAAVALTAIARLVTLPLAMRSEGILREWGLSTQTWGSWFVDLGKSWALGAVLLAGASVGGYALLRAAPRWWWAPAAGAAAALVFLLSFLYPILIEPLFNKFEPLPEGRLRSDLIAMAERDGLTVTDVLVADASKRTTVLNAYVSGYGSSRRIVIYDTLLRDAPEAEVKLVVAHELGHAKHNDVLVGTGLGALAAAAAIIAAFLILRGGVLRMAGVVELADPRSLALVVAFLTVLGLMTSPVQALISRRVEARADDHSLQLTEDPNTFISMHRRLARQNLSDLHPNPVLYFMFASHPATVLRLGEARDYGRRHGIDVTTTPERP